KLAKISHGGEISTQRATSSILPYEVDKVGRQLNSWQSRGLSQSPSLPPYILPSPPLLLFSPLLSLLSLSPSLSLSLSVSLFPLSLSTSLPPSLLSLTSALVC